MKRRWLFPSLALALLGGCIEQEDRDPGTVSVATTLGATSAGGGETTTGGEEAPDDADTMEKLDSNVDTFGDNPGDEGTGCEKVDLLFVIDNSGSMADEQINLVQSFPGFISAMQTELAEASGYNIGVVTTDLYIFDVSCGPVSIGNLVVQTGGPNSSNSTCGPYQSGGAYMTEQDNLADKFSCAAQVGTGGSGDERPMEAMTTALSPALVDAGGCNEGFLREDALLVVVIITDEEDDHETEAEACNMTPLPGSPGEPADWFADLIAVKGGVESNVVVLALVGPDAEAGVMCPTLDKCNGGIAGAEVATRLLEFTRMFTYGFIGPVCNDYGPIFQESISVIKTACDEFVPPG